MYQFPSQQRPVRVFGEIPARGYNPSFDSILIFELGFWVQLGQEILHKWDNRPRRFYPRMEMTGKGLVLGAGTVLAKAERDNRGASRVRFDDEPRAMALLATAYERPVGPYVLAKISRACELWNEGDKALAHIHLAHAGLPPCGEDRALRLFAAHELLGSGVTPVALMEAQGFDPAPLALLKYNPDQPRVPAGHGRESGRWTSDDASGVATAPEATTGRESSESAGESGNIILVSDDNEKERSYEERRERGQESPKDDIEHARPIPLYPEGPLAPPPPAAGATDTGDLQLPKLDPNKLHHIFDNPDHPFGDFVSQFGSQEAAFRAIVGATREAVQQQHISGQFRTTIEVGGRELLVTGNVMDDGKLKIGTAYPWNN